MITFIILAAFFYALKETLYLKHKDSLFNKCKPRSFFGSSSWVRKFKSKLAPSGKFEILQPPLKNWYYRYYNLKYQEKFPGSATIFVFVTDAPHLAQFMFSSCLCMSIAITYEGWDILKYFVFYRVLWFATFGAFFEHILIINNKDESSDL